MTSFKLYGKSDPSSGKRRIMMVSFDQVHRLRLQSKDFDTHHTTTFTKEART